MTGPLDPVNLSWLDDVVAGGRLVADLPRFLRRPVTPEFAGPMVSRRLERRDSSFLAIARRAVYGQRASPYLALLRAAGCEYGDLERLVAHEGLEGTLRALHTRGVYLTIDELKGRQPVVRGSTVLAVDPGGLANPGLPAHLPARSSGSRSKGTPISLGLPFVGERAAYSCLFFTTRGGRSWQHATWGVPGGVAIVLLLELAKMRASIARWYLQVDAGAPGLHPRYRWSSRAARFGSLIGGRRLPRPEYVPLAAPLPIANWASGVRRAGGAAHLITSASSAVRLCQAALQADVDLSGLHLTISGEPITAAKLSAIRRAGASPVPRYGSVECGPIGFGCLAPAAPDDVHLLGDWLALIQPGPAAGSRLPPTALLLTSLGGAMPLILLNVSLGDQAIVETRACGCPLGQLGWTTHLRQIRSFDKLTAGGMTFLDTDVVRILEEILPARFGGGPTDYQLVEGERPDGAPRLRLLVHPALGPLDPASVAETFLAAVGSGPGVERLMGLHWRGADLLEVERTPPRATGPKILHVYSEARRTL